MTLDSTMRLCLRAIKTYEMIDEWIKFVKILDERDALSKSIHTQLSSKGVKKRDVERSIHDLEAWTKTIKGEIV